MQLRALLCMIIGSGVLTAGLYAQEATEKSQRGDTAQTMAQTAPLSSKADSDEARQLRADLERLKVFLNQMRTNLAFVQTTQTPLKHQFELEVDAWQVIVQQMERRVKHMEDRAPQATSGQTGTLPSKN
jgi:hypothetical protein